MKLIVSLAALKKMDEEMPRIDRERLIQKAKDFAADPFGPHPWARPLSGHADRVRLRQGDWRGVVLIVRASETVVLVQVGNRKEVYR
jgi:mRNA interferase RelE/StbE